MDHCWMAHRELNSGLRSRSLGLTEVLGFSHASRNMAARTPCNASREDDHGGGDPQQILRSCAESLLTAVARLEGGERSLTDPAQTPAARSSSPSTSSMAIEEHCRLFGYQTLSSSRCGRRSGTQRGQGPSKKNDCNNKEWRLQSLPSKEHLENSGKITLSFAGLGEKKVVFQKDGKASHAFEKLVEEFPPLAEGGGFEILRTTENSARKLTALPVPPGGYTVPYLKSILGQARGFIRPLQKDLCLQEHAAFQVSLKKRYYYRKLYTGVSNTV